MAGEKVNNEIKRINLIDPNDFTNQYAGNVFSDNKFNVSVPPEDLGIIVELSTYAKGRSILITSTNANTSVNNQKVNIKFNNNEIINLMTFSNDPTTGNQPQLTTHYTDLSTQLETIDEALGLTSIDIDFNSSYTPMVNINFIDVRGGAIFQQGGESKYSVFFRLPYPLFQLKIKGFYGKPVVYCLHLTKFTSKFNSQTGNFEISTNFVGYTYALLADMIMGYMKAAGETPRGQVLLQDRGVMSINKLLQKISQIDESIKGQLNANNSDATTLSAYQKAESSVLDLQDTVLKYVSNLQQLYQVKNLLVSSENNKDVVAISIVSDADRDELYDNVNNFFADLQRQVKAYNSISTNTNLNLINNLGPIFTEIYPTSLVQPIDSTTRTLLQHAYMRYAISDDNQINNLVKRLNDSIPNNKSKLVAFVDFKDCLSVLNAQLDNITTQEKNVEISLGNQLHDKIVSILGFDPNIRNITNIFTTHIEVLLQLIWETAQKSKDPSRVAELSQFQNTDHLDIDSTTSDFTNNIFPWPEYQKNGQEAYLGGPGILKNPEQIPEVQLVNDLYDGMITSQKILDTLSTITSNGTTAWNSMSPIDSVKYQKTMPYDRLPAAINPDDLATYIVLRSTAFLSFSNAFLTADEIKNFATAEARNVINKYNTNFNIINALGNNYKSPSDFLNAASTLGSSTNLKSYVLRPLPQNANAYTYTYIDEKTSNRFILPTDMNFFGVNAVYNLSTTNDEPSKYYLSSRYCDTPDLKNKHDLAFYVDIIEKVDYESPTVLPSANYTPSEFNVQNLFGAPNGDTGSWLASCSFNAANGKYGIQDFVLANYNGTADITGLSDAKPFYTLFYDNSNVNSPNISGGRTSAFLSDWDLYDNNGKVNNFTIVSNDVPAKNKTTKSNELYRNQKNSGQNLLAFTKQTDSASNTFTFSFPFFGFSVEGDRIQNLFGSRFYNWQDTFSRAYLFLHSFPWRGLVVNSVALNEDSSEGSIGLFTRNIMKNVFQFRSGFVQVPKLYPAFIGALIWRYENGGITTGGQSFKSSLNINGTLIKSGIDPVDFDTDNADSLIFNTGDDKAYPTSYQYCNWHDNFPYGLQYAMKFNSDKSLYVNVEDIILSMPSPAKQVFLNEFVNFVNGTNDFSTQGFPSIQKLFEIYPIINQTTVNDSGQDGDLHWTSAFGGIKAKESGGLNNVNNILTYLGPDSSNGAANTFIQGNYSIISYLQNAPYNYVIEYTMNSTLSNTLIRLFLDYKYIANCSWRLWKPNFNDAQLIAPCNASVFVPISDFNLYFSSFNAEIVAAKNSKGPETFNNKNSIEIKHEIYRTLKKIYDKWIASTDSASKAIFQCCTTGGILDAPTRLSTDANISSIIPGDTNKDSLINSFRFINRAFEDIGNKLPINPMAVAKLLIDGTDNSFYDFLSRILTDNNLIFIPLPTYIDYSDVKAVESIFQAYPYYEAVDIPTSGPSFVCMYVGQTSNKLDFGNSSDYPNDGMNLTDPQSAPADFVSDIKSYETPTAAFIVRYGQQNQNIFKDIVLDQAEFTETAESLKITDAIANSYSQTSQSYVGQNLYNVYSVRSYKAEVTMMGNAMIQPMMYFQLENIPMFRGAYLIIGVKHHLQPNSMSTVFTGVRIKKIATPLIDIPTLYTSVLQGYELPAAGTTGIASTYTNYVFKYHDLLRQNLPTNKTIVRSANINGFNTQPITTNSSTELQNWNGGTLSENTAKGTNYIVNYAYKKDSSGKVIYDFRQQIHIPSDPWSAVFVSYIMTFGDAIFPVGTSHYDYATKALDGQNGYELFPLNSGLNIKVEVGDILILPRSGGFTASHGNIVYKIENDTAFLIGGNRGLVPETTAQNAVNYSTQQGQKNDGTVKVTQLKLSGGYVTDTTNVGSYLLIMKKTLQAYFSGKIFSTTASNPSPNTSTVANSKLSNQQLQTNKIEVKNLLKSYFLGKYADNLSRIYVAGVMGNIQVESAGFNQTSLVTDSNGAISYGLLQWNAKTYPNVITDAGPTVNSQIKFLFTNAKFNDFLHQLSLLLSTNNTPDFVAYVFARYFEGCQNCKDYNAYLAKQSNRSTYATSFFNSFNNPSDPLSW